MLMVFRMQIRSPNDSPLVGVYLSSLSVFPSCNILYSFLQALSRGGWFFFTSTMQICHRLQRRRVVGYRWYFLPVTPRFDLFIFCPITINMYSIKLILIVFARGFISRNRYSNISEL